MKANIIKVFIGLIFLIVFNVLFFLLGGTERSDTEWVCYGFIHASYLCLLVTPLLCNEGKGDTVLSASLYLRALFYFFTELVIGLGFIWYNAYYPIPITWPAITQGIPATVFLILQLMSVLANDATKASLAKQRQERVYIRSLAENLKEAMRQVNNPTLRKQMINCYESLSSCSLESFPEADEAELELESAVNLLCSFVEQGDTHQLDTYIQKVQIAIQHRNKAIRMARYS
ncbi:MAG: hypothetical protein J6I54_02530 [Bacteroidaceae bacterium]|nr:hypothetical protein [Bacteroidaceae bacterium]MBR1468138.1 hypothetical protein [Bacteroidaceae bacterium]